MKCTTFTAPSGSCSHGVRILYGRCCGISSAWMKTASFLSKDREGVANMRRPEGNENIMTINCQKCVNSNHNSHNNNGTSKPVNGKFY